MSHVLPERTEARFIMRGDLIAVTPLGRNGQPLTPETFMVTNVAINVPTNDVLVEGLDILGGVEDLHLYLDTLVEIRERGWVDESPAGDWTIVRRYPAKEGS